MTFDTESAFHHLALNASLLQTLNDVGYKTPTPIQIQTIPLLLEGRDVLGQAQTGTGKTAAFALPILSNLNLKRKRKDPQVLVLTPTRELAIQVAEAFEKYARTLKGFRVVPIYGGQDYRNQVRALQRGVHVVVGTPGRVMDHMRRGTLHLGKLGTLVLDEADEMLRMGFIDDVEWILDQTPADRQIALFSATMPQQIRRIAKKHLTDHAEITIRVKTSTADTIRQRYWPVKGMGKIDALTRILEAEPFDGVLIFVRTRTATVELAEKLVARGYAAAPLSGDIAQNQRERTVNMLKKGTLDILVATDVAARGLDVERISHVINFDIPYDTESYVHRIGRTGRAGRQGDAILFVTSRERRMLHAIEKATRKKIQVMELPTTKMVNDQRILRFKERISETLASEDLGFFTQLMEEYQREQEVPPLHIAAALAHLVQGDTPFLLQNKPQHKTKNSRSKKERGTPRSRELLTKDEAPPEKGMERFRIEVGHAHQVQPGNIVGAIANEAGLDSQHIGRINIQDTFTLVDLPEGMPRDIFKLLKKVWVSGQQLRISRLEQKSSRPAPGRPREQRKTAGKGQKRANAVLPRTRDKNIAIRTGGKHHNNGRKTQMVRGGGPCPVLDTSSSASSTV
ncbi:DEAD/DEAH box helicase [Desulfolithobacter sp.]